MPNARMLKHPNQHQQIYAKREDNTGLRSLSAASSQYIMTGGGTERDDDEGGESDDRFDVVRQQLFEDGEERGAASSQVATTTTGTDRGSKSDGENEPSGFEWLYRLRRPAPTRGTPPLSSATLSSSANSSGGTCIAK